MKRLFSVLIFFIISLNLATAEGLVMDNKLSKKEQFAAQMKYDEQNSKSDSVEYKYKKSPGLAFGMSAIVPGAGQYYADKKWWAAGFFGVEVVGLGLWYQSKTFGEDMQDEFKNYADEHWSVEKFLSNLNNWDKCKIGGDEHTVSVVWKTKDDKFIEQELNDDLKDELDEVNYQNVVDYLRENHGEGDLQLVKDRDNYENIGKYDQFACGWDKFEETNESTDTVFNSPNRNNYLNKRKESNDALQLATKSLTVVMFNHLISALHAQLAIKQSSDDTGGEEGNPAATSLNRWELSLVPSKRRDQLIRGVNLSFSF